MSLPKPWYGDKRRAEFSSADRSPLQAWPVAKIAIFYITHSNTIEHPKEIKLLLWVKRNAIRAGKVEPARSEMHAKVA